MSMCYHQNWEHKTNAAQCRLNSVEKKNINPPEILTEKTLKKVQTFPVTRYLDYGFLSRPRYLKSNYHNC